MSDNDWRFEAKCANSVDVQLALGDRVDLFVDVKQDSKQAERMKRFCHSCPVMNQCLEKALQLLETGDRNQYPWGIWGGTTEKDRRKILRQRRKTEATALLLVERLKAQFQDKSDPIAS